MRRVKVVLIILALMLALPLAASGDEVYGPSARFKKLASYSLYFYPGYFAAGYFK
jgi:hypothetical protein